MPSEVSTIEPSITDMPRERALRIISSVPRTPPHLASFTFTPLAHPARSGTSAAVCALSSAITGTGTAASVTLFNSSAPAEAGTGCSSILIPRAFSSPATSTASSGEKASLASTHSSAPETSATARTVSRSPVPPTFIFSIG
jgi:hypothetical protein